MLRSETWTRRTGTHTESVRLRVSGNLVTQTVIRDGVPQGQTMFKYDSYDLARRRAGLTDSGYRRD